MRIIIQRVSEASVTVNEKIIGQINKGFLLLLGIETGDTLHELEWLVNKVIGLRIFSDENGLMNLDINQVNGQCLVISQFTLLASTKKGKRPSYVRSARPEEAIPMYERFIQLLQSKINTKVQTGIFGADMKVALINDGPVTISIDSRNKE